MAQQIKVGQTVRISDVGPVMFQPTWGKVLEVRMPEADIVVDVGFSDPLIVSLNDKKLKIEAFK